MRPILGHAQTLPNHEQLIKQSIRLIPLPAIMAIKQDHLDGAQVATAQVQACKEVERVPSRHGFAQLVVLQRVLAARPKDLIYMRELSLSQ